MDNMMARAMRETQDPPVRYVETCWVHRYLG